MKKAKSFAFIFIVLLFFFTPMIYQIYSLINLYKAYSISNFDLQTATVGDTINTVLYPTYKNEEKIYVQREYKTIGSGRAGKAYSYIYKINVPKDIPTKNVENTDIILKGIDPSSLSNAIITGFYNNPDFVLEDNNRPIYYVHNNDTDSTYRIILKKDATGACIFGDTIYPRVEADTEALWFQGDVKLDTFNNYTGLRLTDIYIKSGAPIFGTYKLVNKNPLELTCINTRAIDEPKILLNNWLKFRFSGLDLGVKLLSLLFSIMGTFILIRVIKKQKNENA